MSRLDRHDTLTPTTPSPMMSLTGAPPDVPPLSWWKYLLALVGVPFRTPTVWDDDPAPDPRDRDRPSRRRPT